MRPPGGGTAGTTPGSTCNRSPGWRSICWSGRRSGGGRRPRRAGGTRRAGTHSWRGSSCASIASRDPGGRADGWRSTGRPRTDGDARGGRARSTVLTPAERDVLARAAMFGEQFWTGGVVALGRLAAVAARRGGGVRARSDHRRDSSHPGGAARAALGRPGAKVVHPGGDRLGVLPAARAAVAARGRDGRARRAGARRSPPSGWRAGAGPDASSGWRRWRACTRRRVTAVGPPTA